jgi:hypothetical protein
MLVEGMCLSIAISCCCCFLSGISVNPNLLKVRAEFVVVVSYSHEKMIIFIPGWEIFTFFTMYFNKKKVR